MKYFLCLLSLSLSTFAFAQNNSIGPAVGVNFANVSNLEGNSDLHIGPSFGFNYTYSSNEHLGFGAGLFFSQEGYGVKNDPNNGKVNLNYIRVPLKAIYFFNTLENPFRPKIFVGPSLGFLLSSYAKDDKDKVEIKDIFEPFDLGITGGLGFNYKLASRTWLNFDLSYTQGVTTIEKVEDNQDHFNQNIGATIGVSYGF
ncbi:MAG: porin family protein [Saprospiraceae bacterium]